MLSKMLSTVVSAVSAIDEVKVLDPGFGIAGVAVYDYSIYLAPIAGGLRVVCAELDYSGEFHSTGASMRAVCELIQELVFHRPECFQPDACYAGILEADAELSGVPEYAGDIGLSFRDQDHWSQARGRA